MTEFTEVVPGGAAWSAVLPAQHLLHLQARSAGACASVLLFAAARPWERMCLPDTLKAQLSACVRPPMVLMSQAGAALCSMVGSSLDWHDALTGHSTDNQVTARFGPSDYAADGNGWRRSARAGLLHELRKHHLDERDLHATVNLFSRVEPGSDDHGTLTWVDQGGPADWVELRTEDEVLVVLSSAPHPLDPATAWAPADLALSVRPAPPAGPDDPPRRSRPEAARALDAVARGHR